MPAPSRFSPQDWEATLVACHYHPEHVKELMKLRDDMHDYEMHVHRLATDPNHKVPDPPNVTMRMGKILGDSVAQFSRDESPLDLACRLSGIDPADVVASLPSEFSRQLDEIGPVEFGQKSFDWDETTVHRETSAHDGKKPGEFAPKETAPSSKQSGLSASHFKTISDDTKDLPPLLDFISEHSGKDGPVPKKEFETAKNRLTKLAEKWSELNWKYTARHSESLAPSSLIDALSYVFGVPSVAAMAGKAAKLKTWDQHPFVVLAKDFSNDIRKLRDELEAIKPRIVTAAQQRETAKVEKKQKEQMAPVTKLSEAILTATESIKPQLQSLYGDWMKHRVEGVNRIRANFVKARAIPASERTPDQASSVRNLFKYYREELSQVQHVLKPSSTSMNEDSDSELDAEKVEKHAKQYASDTADAMRSKINQKLVDVEDPSFLNAGNNTFILNGTRGGKKIRIEQSFKWNTSVLGNSFVQFPALIYVDGKGVSESKYKSMFKPELEPEPKPAEPEKPKGSAQSFISAVREMGYKNPFANEAVVGNAAVELHASPDGSVWLKSIRALTPRKGDGSATLKQLTKLADEHGVEIKGEAVPFGKSMSASKLKKWYVAHGFTLNGEEFTYTPTPRLKIGSGPMRSIPIEIGPVEFSFDESKHPRGQPENSGQFAPVGRREDIAGDSNSWNNRRGNRDAMFFVGGKTELVNNIQKTIVPPIPMKAELTPAGEEYWSETSGADPEKAAILHLGKVVGEEPQEFVFRNISTEYGEQRDAFGVTGTGHAMESMKKAGDLLAGSMSRHGHAVYFFTAAEPSRARLYNRLANKAQERSNGHYVSLRASFPDVAGAFLICRHDVVDTVLREMRKYDPEITPVTA